MRILGPNVTADWRQQALRVSSQQVWRPFDPRVIAFVSEFSRRILNDATMRRFPSSVAMAYWFRDAQLKRLAGSFVEHSRFEWFGRGLVFHLAPANVDTLFLYSFLLSLLCGNTNLMRLSQRETEEGDVVREHLNAMAAQAQHREVGERFLMMTYPHEHEATHWISARCDVRVIWGGNDTVRKIRQVALKPSALEIPFSNRFSLAALKAEHVLALASTELNQLAEQFFNDAYWFNQQACASPRVVSWIGNTEAVANARRIFWQAIQSVIDRKEWTPQGAESITRLTDVYRIAMQQANVSVLPPSSPAYPWLAQIAAMPAQLREQHSGYGWFAEIVLGSLKELGQHISEQDQTLTVAGFSKSEIDALFNSLAGPGLMRVVPVGQALTFDTVWDGIDLLRMFTRQIVRP